MAQSARGEAVAARFASSGIEIAPGLAIVVARDFGFAIARFAIAQSATD
jgi:hypothetical protein